MRYSIIAFLFLLGCAAPEQSPDKKINIVCTTGMIGDAVTNMINDGCEIRTLMGPGTDPHLYKPTKESLDLLSAADIIVANGLHLEGRMQDILEKLSRTKTVIFIGETLPENVLIYADENGAVPDPHIWFDASIWRHAITNLGDQLLEVAPACINSDLIAEYDKKLEDLEQWIQIEMAQISAEQRVLITAHDAFSYFGIAYDIEVIGLQGISTMAEYGIRDVTNLVDEIVDRQIKAVFVESSVSSRSIEAVVAGCQERGFEVSEGGTLYSDALGPKDSGADTYIGMVRYNVTTIKNALK
jgi:manganese/zinc/iron transport system substrate-binding protein